MATERDIQDVINTLIAEGIGEGEEGMRRIAETILNRAEQRGISPAEVVRQRGQYTGYSAPGPGAIRAQRDPASITAAQAAWNLAQGPDDPTGGANHYWNPGIVSPSWAGGMQSLGTYGNHAFASDRPIMAQSRVAPTPASVEDRVTARNTAQPIVTPLQSALDQYVTRERNRVTPAPVEDRVTARNTAIARTDALNDAARRASLSANQSYVGQDRSAPRSAFNGDPGTPASGPVVASIPSRPQTLLQQSAVGSPPTTRTVPTTTVRPMASAAKNIADARSEQAAQRAVGRAPIIPDRLSPSPAGLPALYGSMTPQQVSQIGVPSLAPPAVTPMRNAPTQMVAPVIAPRSAPVPFQRPAVAPIMATSVPMAAPRPIQAPLMASAQQIPQIVVRGSNQIAYPLPKPQSITNQQRLNNARDAVSQSGDNSVGNQRDAAEARSSGTGGRTRRY